MPDNSESASGLPARRGAIRLLTLVDEGRPLPDGGSAVGGLAPADGARARRLAATVLRQESRADRLLDDLMEKRPPPFVLRVLRLATVEICQMGTAPHGAVNDAVALVASHGKHRRLKGLVNAVLRRVAVSGPDAWADLPTPRMPAWPREPLIRAYGAEAVERMEEAQSRTPPVDLTLRRGRSAPEGGERLPTGSIRFGAGARVSALPGFGEGDWWVQDAAAALPVRLLDPRPGERVLDLCAAPGGKTMQLADAGAVVTALDVSKDRAARLRENLSRTGLSAEIVVADALLWEGGPFDAVLVDAPCSATGTMRRHPDLPRLKTARGVKDLVEIQRRLIDRALRLVRPGGRIVYCACSLLPEEGGERIRDALERHPGLFVEDGPEIEGVDPSWRAPGGGIGTRPDYWNERGGMDGFHMARLVMARHVG